MSDEQTNELLQILIGKIDALTDAVNQNMAISKAKTRQERSKELIPEKWFDEITKLDDESLDLFLDWWEAKTPLARKLMSRDLELWYVLFDVWCHYNPDKLRPMIASSAVSVNTHVHVAPEKVQEAVNTLTDSIFANMPKGDESIADANADAVKAQSKAFEEVVLKGTPKDAQG